MTIVPDEPPDVQAVSKKFWKRRVLPSSMVSPSSKGRAKITVSISRLMMMVL